MKELSIEEKAKAYDMALENAKHYHSEMGDDICCVLEECFPELKESEDEVMRAMAIKAVHAPEAQSCIKSWGINPDDVIAWLEKQGEQKPTDKVEPKFRTGDWVVCYSDIDRVKRVTDRFYHFESGDYGLIKDIDKDYHLWTIQDAKDGDVLAYKDEISIYKHDIKNCTKEGTNFGGFVYHCCYDDKRFITDSLYSLTEKDKKDIYPATKEQHDILIKAMADAGYEWDVKKKELKKQEIAEIPFGAKDSELQEATYYIPKGFHVEIDGNKVVIKKGNQKFIKYIRKDAFIEKASKWIEENIKKWYENIKVHGFRGMTPLMITKFKKYMEE